MSKVQLVPKKTNEAKVVEPLTKRRATGGDVIKLSKEVKGIAESIHDKAARRQYLNMQLDAERSRLAFAKRTKRSKDKEES